MSNRVVHFEIPCDNPEKTIDFFKEVFDWKFQQFGTEPYWLATAGDEGQPGINGAIMKKKDPKQPLVNSIDVPDIDAYVEKIEKAGGTICVPKTTIPGVGWLAFFNDPDGNVHGLWQHDISAK